MGVDICMAVFSTQAPIRYHLHRCGCSNETYDLRQLLATVGSFNRRRWLFSSV